MARVVLISDHPWPELDIETSMIESAGYRLVAGPQTTPPASVVEGLAATHDPVAIMTCWAQISAVAIARSSHLAIVHRMGVGLDCIDVAAATARGAWVTNVPDYCVEEVSDHTVAMLLNLWRGVIALDREVKAGHWNPGGAKLRRVATMTVGIIGYGRTGTATARKLRGFGCRVLANNRTLLAEHRAGVELAPGIVVADLDTIRQSADAIVIHAPLTAETHHLIDDLFIAGLARKPLLVNVSRGAVVDNDALVRGLERGLIAAAALDVVEGEPSPPVSVTRRNDVIVTPHIAFSSDASLEELRRRSVEEVLRVLRGESPRHPCNRVSQ
jgi:D-3-phosphoglycerate dehydrogenase